MKIILSLMALVCFSLMGFFYYRFCKKTSDEVLNILKNEKEKSRANGEAAKLTQN